MAEGSSNGQREAILPLPDRLRLHRHLAGQVVMVLTDAEAAEAARALDLVRDLDALRVAAVAQLQAVERRVVQLQRRLILTAVCVMAAYGALICGARFW